MFALSILPESEDPVSADVVVLVDTSASQIGLFREDSLRLVRRFVAGLSADDRVQIAAVDIELVGLTSGWVSPGSSQVTQALERLEARTPLGATDLVQAFERALDLFAQDSRRAARSIVLIGDAESRANLFDDSELRELIRRCRIDRVSISTYVIGPQRDVKFAAILAHHTGGTTLVDREGEAIVDAAATALAKAVHVPVWYPMQTTWSRSVAEAYPAVLPPLRGDRDSIVVGRLAKRQTVKVTARLESARGNRVLELTLKPEASSSDVAFLPLFLEIVRQDDGLRMPTPGSEGLREVARLLTDPDEKSGSADSSGKNDSESNDSASSFDWDRLLESHVWYVATQEPAGQEGDEGEKKAGDTSGRAGDDAPAGKLLEEVRRQQQVLAAKMEAEVQVHLKAARKLMADAPDRAQESLKILLEQVREAPELQPEMRARLIDQIEVALKQAARRQLAVDEERRIVAENQARAEESRRLIEELQRNRGDAKKLMERFHSLMAEAGDDSEKYLVADEEIAQPIRDRLIPNESIGTSAVWRARLMRQIVGHESFREKRHRDFADTLYLVDRA
ncbi:MAG TPA: VWA domain-containing protein, partial [Planctomycetaceae bacterium]|nr:VWA domain-containing protein [Planctomycetaceae bacterium]